MKVVDTLEDEKPQVLATRVTESEIFRYHRYLPAGEKCRVWDNTAVAIALDEPVKALDRDEVLASDTASVRICPPRHPRSRRAPGAVSRRSTPSRW